MAVAWNPALTEKRSDCNCAPCRSFWKKAFQEGGERITLQSHERSGVTAILSKDTGLVRKGDRVLVKGSALEKNADQDKFHHGTVHYVGLPDEHLIAPEMKIGVCLYDNVYSTHNGIYKGKRYFFCPRGHGAMIGYGDLTRLNPAPRIRPVVGNKMFPSFEEVKKRRKLREQKIKDAEEKLRKDHELKRRIQMERFSKSAPPPRISPRPTRASKMRVEKSDDKPQQRVQDSDDIAYKDFLAKEKQRLALYVNPDELEEQQFRQMKKAFGGDEKAERMAETFKKLQRGYEEGRIIALAEQE